jgi:tRNA nucleotidyltransferase (CCA-adding enzyme)
MTFPEAARRRDFTINAIGWDPLTDEYLDPYGGREDLNHRLLRAVDASTFADDSLRALRAVQFAARFEFALDEPTSQLCRTMALDDLPAERVWGEIENLLFAARPSVGLALALDLGIVGGCFPNCTRSSDEDRWHPGTSGSTRCRSLTRPQALG